MSFLVPDSAVAGYQIMKLEATDEDFGAAGEISFSVLQSDLSIFAIQGSSNF